MAPLSHRQLAAAALLLAMAALAMPASAARQPSDPAPRSVIAQSAQETQRDRRHEIDSLPGYSGELSSKHYSGYLSVGAKRLFYYFATSQRSPAKDPVVLWLNGGPGCSSFDGFVYEHGPFNFRFAESKSSAARAAGAASAAASASDRYPAVELVDNPYSWNTVANVLYLDSPAGVGLSYSKHAADYTTNDTQTAADAEAALRAFFDLFDEFRGNEFYVSGESYAGIYVPNLVQAIVKGNAAGAEPTINVKGYLVGNGCTDEKYDGNAFPLFAMGKSLISVAQYEGIRSACGANNYWNPTSGDCEKQLGDMQRELAGLNLYDILENCYHGGDPHASLSAAQLQQVAQKQQVLRETMRTWPVTGAVKQGSKVRNWKQLLGHAPPCTDSRLAWYWLNTPEVRDALGAANVRDIGHWELCTDKIDYTHDTGSMIPVHTSLTKDHGLRALIYSGDHDLCVPHTGSEAWTRDLGWPVTAPWAPWLVGDRQVAGYAVGYSAGPKGTLTYATIKGAGHMVPQSKPEESLAFFERFLADKFV